MKQEILALRREGRITTPQAPRAEVRNLCLGGKWTVAGFVEPMQKLMSALLWRHHIAASKERKHAPLAGRLIHGQEGRRAMIQS